MIQKLFPFSNRATDLTGLIISIAIYIVVSAIFSFLAWLLDKIPVIGWALDVVSWLIGLYAFIGIIVSVLIFLKVIK